MANGQDVEKQDLKALVAQVSAAYFANVHVPASEIPGVIAQIAASLAGVGQGGAAADGEPSFGEQPKLTRAQIRKSITHDTLVSFEDGKSYKTLRRHLATRGLTPADYRAKWGLASDYPMVAPAYSEARSQMAKSLGLGQRAQQARKAAARKGNGPGKGNGRGRAKAAAK